jgi:hypothetical protein
MKVRALKHVPIFDTDARTDNVEPIEKKFTIEKVLTEPNLQMPKHDAPEPNLKAHLMERSEPKFTKPNADSRPPVCLP